MSKKIQLFLKPELFGLVRPGLRVYIFLKGSRNVNLCKFELHILFGLPFISFDVDVVCIVGWTVEGTGRVGWGVATVLEQRRTVHPVRATVKQPCQR
jgi:hypothetical protein